MQYHESLEGEEPDYPKWGIFMGVMIVLSSVLMIPLVLIVRLIIYTSARDEAKDFFVRVYQSGKDAVNQIKRLAERFELTKYS